VKNSRFFDRHFFIGVVVGLILMLVFLSASLIGPALGGPFPTSKPGCYFSGEAMIWDDHDVNGNPDQDEQPLANVEVKCIAGGKTLCKGVSDENGKIDMYFFNDCKPIEMKVLAEVPEGYQATTPVEHNLVYETFGTGHWQGGDFYFGFKRK